MLLIASSKRIATQIILLLAISSVVAIVGVASIYLVMAPEYELPPNAMRRATNFIAVLAGLDALPPASRAQLLSAYKGSDFTASILDRLPDAQPDPLPVPERLRSWLSRQLPPGIRIMSMRTDGENQATAIAALSDGQLIAFRVPRDEAGHLPLPIVLTIAFMIVSTTLLSIWAALRLVSPLSRFVAAVDRFGTHGHEAALEEEGPAEIRQAASAFNRMQERILRLLEDRTRMLMAISHDLRTPLTRLRLRSEELTEDDQRLRMLEDIELMNASITSAISYVREGGMAEAPEAADLPSLVETICDQFEDDGHPIAYDGPARLTVRCLPLALGRALTNLVDNAVKFGTSVTVRVETTEEPTGARAVSIEVEDDGPGIPDSEKLLVLEPFYRTDTARRGVGGFGLGLAIALTVARHHAGTLTLHDRLPHGLRARLTIPLTAPTTAPMGIASRR
jgi:signal transduction histidine kinase